MKLDDAISNRRSIRSFSRKKVRWDHVLEAIDAALKAPFAGNVNNLQFIIAEDQESKNVISQACQQDWVADSSIVVVVVSDSKHMDALYGDHSEAYSEMQTGAAIENFLLKITDMKLASCWIGAFVEDTIKESLRIPDKFKVEAVLPIGHPTIRKTKSTKKNSLEMSIHWGRFGQRKKPFIFKDPSTKAEGIGWMRED